MSATTQINEVQDRVLTNVESVQHRILELNQSLADVVDDRIPTERLSLSALPGMPELPSTSELVDSYFDFTAKLSEVNRAFYKQMLAMWAPETAKPAKKAPARKATAKKAKAD